MRLASPGTCCPCQGTALRAPERPRGLSLRGRPGPQLWPGVCTGPRAGIGPTSGSGAGQGRAGVGAAAAGSRAGRGLQPAAQVPPGPARPGPLSPDAARPGADRRRTEGRKDGRGAQGDRAGERVGPTRAAEGRRGSCAHRRRAGRTSVFPRWLRDAGLWPGPSGRPRAQGSIGPQGTDRAVARSPVPLRPAGPVRFGRVWPWGGAGTRGS